MNEVISNWTSFSWWLNHIPAALVALGIGGLFKYVPKFWRALVRKIQIRELNKIRKTRFNYSAVHYEISKTHSLMLLFSTLCIYYLYEFSISAEEQGGLMALIKTLPLYIVEIFYFYQRSFTKLLIKSVGKIS
ncbi:hypothetical protein D5018_04325 [Parashewanella curva]|uniref:Uncharacterized protein n=1 Tax=Parashewanella curva TaxID=2338552 RepID=A0A3L8PZY3_9GAMM|nr:hypothetical protein [Parashewanella curva]RLV60875.1 hypothetical protein D5018_04325 [Parashewanella curva]